MSVVYVCIVTDIDECSESVMHVCIVTDIDEYSESVMHVSIVTDIDECSESANRCSHMCKNTDGGFTCSCPPGMMLDNDDRTCVSKYGWTMMTIPVSVSIDRH